MNKSEIREKLQIIQTQMLIDFGLQNVKLDELIRELGEVEK